MERLTGRDETGIVYVPQGMVPEALERLAVYEDTGLEPCDYKTMRAALEQCEEAKKQLNELICIVGGAGFERIRELAQADKEGRLVVLPCGMDATIYDIRSFYRGTKVVRQEITSGEIDHFTIGQAKRPIATVCLRGNEWADYEPDELILTREDAEKALVGETNVGHTEGGGHE